MTDEHPTSRPSVVLRHDLPDGSHHFDWLLAREPAGVEPLYSFRLERRPDQLRPGEALRGERLFDHRSLYLEYEGPIAGGRGSVRRLRQGRIWMREEGETVLEALVEWGGGPSRMLFRAAAIAAETPFWRIVCLEIGRL